MFLYRFNIEKMLDKSDKNVCVMNTDDIRGYLSSYQEHNGVSKATVDNVRHNLSSVAMQKVWVGYYDGNIKSKRVQEKCGFKYQWRSENVDVPLMHEKRTGHVSLMTKADWQELR